jgi:hypothetical protein
MLCSCQKDWVAVKIDEDYQALFPGQPTYKETTQSSKFGDYIKRDWQYAASIATDDNPTENPAYTISISQMPLRYDLSSEQTFDEFANQEIALLGGQLVSKKSMTFKGASACELLIDFRGGEYRVKTVLFVNNRKIYNMGVVTEKKNLFNTDINKFINSVRRPQFQTN